MGAGRQTQTYLVPASGGPSGGGAIGPPPQRNLGKTDLGGVIFGCTHVTMNECLTKNLFGLPAQHIKYVQHIRPGMCLFLFNYSGRLLHGIYEAVGDGALNIDPTAWTEGRGKTQFPAQVKFKIRQSCSPLSEPVFKEAILDNYFSEIKFTFELTISQKDHLLSLFTKNMQGLTKSFSSNTPSQALKIGGPVKGLKKVGDSEDPGAAKRKTFMPSIGNAWQKVGPVDSGKESSDDVKSYSFHHSGKLIEEAFETSSENLFNASKPASGTRDGTSDDNPSVYPEVSRQKGDYAAYGVASFQGQSSDVKNVDAGNGDFDKNEFDKAARQRSILEKLQRLDPSRADISQQQQPTVIEKFQGLNITSVDQSQQRDNSQSGFQYSTYNEVDSTGGTVVAITPRKMHADWERHAEEKAAHEQAVLREDRDRLWVTTSAVDMNTARVFKRSLEVSANTIAQMRQDSREFHRLLIELRARTDQQLEQQKTLERLLTTNAMLEQSQASMAAELAKVRLEMSELKSQINILNTHGEVQSNKHLSTSRPYAGSPVSGAQLVPQAPHELYILGGLADVWLDSVVGFSPHSNQLKNVSPLLAPRSYAASSILHGYIYLYGGGDGTSWSDSVERYNRASDMWEICPSMAIKRGSLGGATVRDKIYALGGGNGAISFDDTECYDPVVGIWTASAKMLERRFCVASAELNGVIYALGGFDGQNYLMSVERFDPREGLWTAIAPLSIRRGSLSAAVLNEKLYALGGFDGRDFLNSVEIYDPRATKWMSGPSMISPRSYGASAVLGDALYTLGGMEYMNQSFQTSKMKVTTF
ncbi:hypothetical protein KC19_9G104000 [Ceratodon purpureus]|uniref:DCD domain-containing protein n=1 Tax=Ceratodon purpureus TaxID=3225 RepID=A0A8T0GTN8_CERPU|nr:hypothetical protein KC19_9G104000 [Ceratodon purpureus]KAG0561931.1 hypothetical protein KC19_9G104000 [Ceratodon purpureus]